MGFFGSWSRTPFRNYLTNQRGQETQKRKMAANSYDRADFIMNGVARSRKEDNGVHPAFFLDNGPILPSVQLPSLDPTLVNNSGIDYIDSDSGKTAYVNSWNVSIQHELPGKDWQLACRGRLRFHPRKRRQSEKVRGQGVNSCGYTRQALKRRSTKPCPNPSASTRSCDFPAGSGSQKSESISTFIYRFPLLYSSTK